MMEDESLPCGWRREESGKYHYLSRNPQVKIVKKCQLESFHRAGRYLEMSVSSLDFGTKTRTRKFSVVKGSRKSGEGEMQETEE